MVQNGVSDGSTGKIPPCPYGFGTIKAAGFEEVLDVLAAALEARGFCITSQIDVQQMLQETGSVESQPCRIIGISAPHYAAAAYRAEPSSGLLLSGSIVVRVDPASGSTVVTALDPAWVMDLLRHPAAIEAAIMIKSELEDLIEEL